MKFNTSTVTITSNVGEDTSASSSSSSSNVTQVTVTAHPIESSTPMKTFGGPTITVMSPGENVSEVVIVANETNKTQINESSTDDDCYPSLDSLEANSQDQPINIVTDNHVKGQKLDGSEVVIVNSRYIDPDDSDIRRNRSGLDLTLDESVDSTMNTSKKQDMSHVSVVTVGETEDVKNSTSLILDGKGDISINHTSDARNDVVNNLTIDSRSDISNISNVSIERSTSSKSESGK